MSICMFGPIKSVIVLLFIIDRFEAYIDNLEKKIRLLPCFASKVPIFYFLKPTQPHRLISFISSFLKKETLNGFLCFAKSLAGPLCFHYELVSKNDENTKKKALILTTKRKCTVNAFETWNL